MIILILSTFGNYTNHRRCSATNRLSLRNFLLERCDRPWSHDPGEPLPFLQEELLKQCLMLLSVCTLLLWIIKEEPTLSSSVGEEGVHWDTANDPPFLSSFLFPFPFPLLAPFLFPSSFLPLPVFLHCPSFLSFNPSAPQLPLRIPPSPSAFL